MSPHYRLDVEENQVVSEKRNTMEDLAVVGWDDGECDTKITILRQERGPR